MPSILIVAHAPMASSLQAIARHCFADCGRHLAALDIADSATLEQAETQVRAALAALPGAEALILTDVFGATPSNAALNVSDGQHRRVVSGVNVPMLWRTLCYAELPLHELVTRAVDGGQQGIMQVAAPRRQNQPNHCAADDPVANPDQ